MRSVLDVRAATNGAVAIRGEQGRVEARMLPPAIGGRLGGAFRFGASRAAPGRIGGVEGRVESDESQVGKVVTIREIFRSADGTIVGLRMSVVNGGQKGMRLHSLTPLRAEGGGSVVVGGAGLKDWRVLRMSRHKNDVPGCYLPAEMDADFEHALIDSSEVRAGMGMTAQDAGSPAANPTLTCSEPCICIKNRHAPSLPGLFLGVLGQTEHLTRIALASSADQSALDSLTVECEFDDVLVLPGEKRSTHWILLWEEPDEQDMLRAHADLLGKEFGVPPPKTKPPSIFCSWQFYGRDFSEQDLLENLRELKRRPIPFDVFLIDNGWKDQYGSWNANELFPKGMRHAADAIREAGYEPGIWTAPFVVHQDAPVLKMRRRLIARDRSGSPCTFPYREAKSLGELFVVDPTAPEAEEFFSELYGRLRSWGFRYHKFDFLRALVIRDEIRFHDRGMNRAQAYRKGLSLIRKAVGEDGYILACGGLFEGSAGLADGNRVGSDVRGRWHEPGGKIDGHLMRIKQNVFRSHGNRLWHTDPDALQVRRRKGPFRGQEAFAHLSDGSFTDDEAFTCVVNHYLGGGIVGFSERMAELHDDRLALFRHVIPVAAPPARILDAGHPECPTLFLTRVVPKAKSLGEWWTLAVANWEDNAVAREVSFEVVPFLPTEKRIAVFELATQTFLGVKGPGGGVRLEIPPHGTRVLRLAAWDGQSPMLLGTDLHLTGGAAELARFEIGPAGISGAIDSPWNCPIVLAVGFPAGPELRAQTFALDPGRREFHIS